uniref:Late blight resistance protein n=1 Tax=Solanum tuberosum TaxID=4113 RepID=M1BFF9_SOLTU
MGLDVSFFLDDHTQVPRISIQHTVDPTKTPESVVSAELRKPGQWFAWGQQWSPSVGPSQGVGSGRDNIHSSQDTQL